MKGLRPLATAVAVLALAGCKDSGLPGMNLPLQVAEHKPTPYPLYAYPQGQLQLDAAEVAGRDWLLVRVEERIPDAMLVAVGGVNGAQHYVLAWDMEPYDRVYEQVAPGRYTQRVQIPRMDLAAAAALREAAADAEHDTGH
ncbi:MAG: hypothetical protein WEB88_08925 [Gemmatimonadota bacterium]